MREAMVVIDRNDLEVWRQTIEQRVYRQLVETGSHHASARRLSRFEADRQLEAEIARVALQRYSWANESRERRVFAGISADTEWNFDDDQSKGAKGKSHSGGRKRRKAKPPYEPGSRLGSSAA